MSINEGPLSKLLRATGHTEPLEPLPTVQRITEAPLKVGVPVSASTPHRAICSCRIFEKERGSELCPACGRKQAARLLKSARDQQHHDSIRRELAARVVDNAAFSRRVQAAHQERTERRLTVVDPEWRDKFLDWTVAEVFYRLELLALPDNV